MLALYLWTYYSSVLAHAVFLGLPAVGAVGRRSAWAWSRCRWLALRRLVPAPA